ncbi:MAG: Asp-tRNA(Asn)/Glu-tRNA(Gln) amidotransferase GatCAB subunit A [Luteitalea sp.]|nr:Asp-tRNA(Asn)/Glu-tRNA(Gln) amidotransferase GatCAB subunit A [Luteitalea sp.]
MTTRDVDLDDLTVAAAVARLADRSLRASDLLDACLARLHALSGSLNAFITVTEDEARRAAAAADVARVAGRSQGPLHGIPIALKDLIDQQGVRTTAASRVRDEAPLAATDAAVTARLRAAGAVLVGKCNLHEFAFGSTNQDSAFGPVRHPSDPTRLAGGSSGGSAVAVATGMALAALGSDTGGSVRIPAAACGIVGLKPAFGEVPLDGVVPLSVSLDHIGPLCRTAEDAWLLHTVLAAVPADHAAPPPPRTLSLLRARVLRGYFLDLLEDDVRERFESAVRQLADRGARIHEGRIAHADEIVRTYAAITVPEAVAWHAPTLATHADRYTAVVRERLEAGRQLPAVEYLQAQARRRVLRQEVAQALDDCDILLLPTLPCVAPHIGQANVRFGEQELPARVALLRLTQLFNLTGHPAVTLPCGNTKEGLPVGLQIAGRDTRELIGWARGIEREVESSKIVIAAWNARR